MVKVGGEMSTWQSLAAEFCSNEQTAAQQLIVPIPCRHVSVSVSVSAWADLTLRSPGMEEEIGDNGPGEEGDTSRWLQRGTKNNLKN